MELKLTEDQGSDNKTANRKQNEHRQYLEPAGACGRCRCRLGRHVGAGEHNRTEMTDIKETLRQEVNTRREGQGALEARIRALESSQARLAKNEHGTRHERN